MIPTLTAINTADGKPLAVATGLAQKHFPHLRSIKWIAIDDALEGESSIRVEITTGGTVVAVADSLDSFVSDWVRMVPADAQSSIVIMPLIAD